MQHQCIDSYTAELKSIRCFIVCSQISDHVCNELIQGLKSLSKSDHELQNFDLSNCQKIVFVQSLDNFVSFLFLVLFYINTFMRCVSSSLCKSCLPQKRIPITSYVTCSRYNAKLYLSITERILDVVLFTMRIAELVCNASNLTWFYLFLQPHWVQSQHHQKSQRRPYIRITCLELNIDVSQLKANCPLNTKVGSIDSLYYNSFPC